MLVVSASPMSFANMPDSSVQITHMRVFGAGKNGGNPCPVIVDHDGTISTAAMQALAKRFGQDTAFIVPAKNKGADLSIRYFVPDHEMGVSGHATIAAITVALTGKMLVRNPVQTETINGLFEARWTEGQAGILITLDQNAPEFGAVVAPERVARVLGIQPSDITAVKSPAQTVSVSRPKILVPLTSSRILNSLTPDFEALWRLCDEEKVSGLYPFTRHSELRNVDAEARQFPLRAGFSEDAATGVAAAALAAYLTRYDFGNRAGHREFRIAQGYAMGAPSLIEATADCSDDGRIVRTAIRGSARVVKKEEVRL